MSAKDSKTRKKIPQTSSSPSPVETMKATTLPRRSAAAQRSRSAFVNGPSTTELIRMFTESSALSSPPSKKNKKQRKTMETTSESLPRPSRKDEIFRALKAQAQAAGGKQVGSESPVARFLAKAEEALSSPERVAVTVDPYGKPTMKKRVGSKTLSGILRAPTEVPKHSVNITQSSEGPKKNAAAAVIVKKKRSNKAKCEGCRQAEYLAAAEIEDLLGMPISIQNQLRQVQRELRLKKELSTCNLKEGLEPERKHAEDEGPDGDDLLFPPIMSPKHDDYPILDDNRREETTMDAMKYVHNALALWVVSNNNSEAGTPLTVEETGQLLPEAKIPNQTNTHLIDAVEDFLTQDLQSPPFSSIKNPKMKGPKCKAATTKKRSTRPPTRNSTKNLAEMSSTPSCHSTPTLDENGNQTSDTTLVASSLKLLCGQAASTQTFSIGNPICTQTGSSLTSLVVQPEPASQQDNVSVLSNGPKTEDSKPPESDQPSRDFSIPNTSQSKVPARTTSCGVQVGQMVPPSSLTRPSSSAMSPNMVSNNALLGQDSSRPSVGSTCEGPVAQRSTEMTLELTGPDSNNNDLMQLASSAKIQIELASAARIQRELASMPKIPQELASVAKIQPDLTSVPKIQEELASAGKNQQELPSIQQEISPKKVPVDEVPPETAPFSCYINDESKEMGSSFEKITCGAQATDNLYSSGHEDPRGNNSGGDTQFQIGEVKCYEPDSQQTVACQPNSPSVHTVGVTGVAKTWSLTAYNHPVRSRPIKTIATLREALGYSASTQTIDETHAECQTGGSFPIFTDPRQGQYQDCSNEEAEVEEGSEEWDDDIRMHAADEVLDSESLLEMSGKIVQHINDLDLGTNIEKISHTLSTTVRVMTEIITDMVVTEDESLTSTNDDEEDAELEVFDEVRNEEEESLKKFTEQSDEPGEPEKMDTVSSSEFQDKRYPAEFYPEELDGFPEKPQLDPTLSATSL